MNFGKIIIYAALLVFVTGAVYHAYTSYQEDYVDNPKNYDNICVKRASGPNVQPGYIFLPAQCLKPRSTFSL